MPTMPPALHNDAQSLHQEVEPRVDVEARLTSELRAHGDKAVADEHLFTLLVDSVKDYAIFMLDPGGHVVTWNAGAERIKGYSADDIIGRHFSTFYPEDVVRTGLCERELREAAATGRFEDEGWRLRKDGSRLWANVVISAVRDGAGTLIGFSKVTRDLSERKRAEDARVAAEERFRLLVDSVRDYAIFMVDPDGRVATWNVGAERIKGYRGSEIIGRHISAFYPEEDVRAGKIENELAVAASEGRYAEEGWRVRKDGSLFWASVVITAIRSASGELTGFAKVTRDLTERRAAQAEQAAREAAEQANRAKDEFLAMLGHELRNPMAPIVTALQLMKLRGDERSVSERDVIERQVRHMMRLIDDLLDVSSITRGKVALKKQLVDVRDIVAKAVEIAIPLLEQRRHHLEIDAASRPMVVDADDERLTQVVANLLTNAAKYTEPGGRVSLTIAERGPHIDVEVRDTGVGIAPALLPHVFDLFVQGAQNPDRPHGGLGLGLALVRSLVALHGGTVEARSGGPGTGSSFTVQLPAVHRAAAEAPAPPERYRLPAAITPRRILVVDDNEDACVLLAQALSSVGHQVREALDPLQALEVLTSFVPEVAILDIGLPVMDGYQLAGRIREQLGTAPRLIALSGYGQKADRERSQVAGFDLHLVKPVDIKRLLASIEPAPDGE